MQRKDDIESGALKLFPAQELKRGGARKKPRDWKQRWRDAGGKLIDGRMVALVEDPIWARLSRWGDPLPPYDYNSGMKLFKVSRANAIRLGLLPKPESAARKAKPESGEKRPVPAPETPKASDVAKAKLERASEAILGVPAPVEPPLSPAIKANAQIVAKAVGVKLGAPMTFEQGDGMKGNPNYGKSEHFSKNCQSCVVANELRRRGMNVRAQGYDLLAKSGYQFDVARDCSIPWLDKSGNRPKFTQLASRTEARHLEELGSATREEGRYFVLCYWKTRGGHIFTAERLSDGKLRLYDPQTGAIGDEKKGIFDRFGENYFSKIRGNMLYVMKVDDLIIADPNQIGKLVRAS